MADRSAQLGQSTLTLRRTTNALTIPKDDAYFTYPQDPSAPQGQA